MDNKSEDKRMERLKQINTAAESSLDIGVSMTIVMIVIFLVLIQDDVNLVLFIILSLGIFTMLVLSYDGSGLIRRSSGLLLPWYLWMLKGFCFFVTNGSLPDITITEYTVSTILQIAPAALYEYSAPSVIRSGIGLRVFFFGIAILDLIPFPGSNPFLSLERGVVRSVMLSVLFILSSIRSRYDTSATSPEDSILITFIRIQYTLFAGFWLSVAAGIVHAVYIGLSVMITIPKRVQPKKRPLQQEKREEEEYASDGEEPLEKTPYATKPNQLDSFASESLTSNARR